MPTNEKKIIEEEEDTLDCVKTIGNELHFYGEITQENTLEFVEAFKKLEILLLKHKADLIGYEPKIRVNIMSEGGDVYLGSEYDEYSGAFEGKGHHNRSGSLL